MLSIDGLRAAAIDDPTLSLPSLRGLIARGARARALRPIFPTVTWPCHTSIVTGVSPARHGLGPMQAWLTLEASRHVLAVRPPALLLIHFLTLDSYQHDYGVDAPESRWALLQMDALLGRLLATLEELGRAERTAVMVFGD